MITWFVSGKSFLNVLLITAALAVAGCSGDDTTTEEAPAAIADATTATVPAERPDESEEPSAGAVSPPEQAQGVPASSQPSTPGEDWLRRYEDLDLDNAFAAVATGIRYEPYRGVLRGAEGTALANSGNSLDQSLLLATVLRHNGYRVRFVRGRLDSGNLEAILRGIYPPELPEFEFGPDYAPYQAKEDPGLGAAADHFWVEAYQPGKWLPLDPSFPRAVPGEAYAPGAARFDEIPKEYYQTLSISLRQELRDGKVLELGSLEEPVVSLGLEPLSLIVYRVPKSSTESDKKPRGTGATLGGMGGSLGGGKPEPQVADQGPKLVAVEHQRRLFVNGEFVPWEGTLVAEQERAGFIKREWLEFEVSQPGAPSIRTQRELYRHWPGGPTEPQAIRHYAISVVPGPLTDEWLQAERERVGETLDLENWQRELRKANNAEPGSKKAASLAPVLSEYGDLAGIGGGHLLGLTHAATSDELSRQVAWSNGVAMIWPIPRILITSVETEEVDGGGSESNVTLDLRLDRVQAIPYPGVPARAAKLFQTARGLKNTSLEGTVLSAATGMDVPVTTAAVMIKAAVDGTPVVTIDQANATHLGSIEGLPAHSNALIADALRGGHDIIIPQRAALLSGRDRWGWWQVNPDTGEVIGVMDDGQHQATTNYTFSLSKVGLDDKSGFAIGAIIGANSTLFTISGLMLKYGQTSPAMIAEVEQYVKAIMCSSCPSKAGISAGASAGASASNDCLKIEKKKEAGMSVSASIGFCESYQEGFSCASGLLLRGLTGGSGGAMTIGAEANVSVQVNCESNSGGIQLGN